MKVEELEERLSDIETRLADAETNEEWDRLEPELRKLRLAVWDAVEEDRADLAGAKEKMRRRFSWWSYINPFDATARDRYRDTVSRKKLELEQDQTLEERLAHVVARFYADKTRAHARELIRVAEKVQRDVPGDWPAKAGAAYGALVTGRGGDAAIATAEAVRRVLAGRPADEGSVIGAAILAGTDSTEKLARISDSLASDEISGRLLGPALASGRSVEDAVGFVKGFREKQNGRAFDSDAILAAAGLLGRRPVEESYTSLSALETAAPGEPTARARLAAGAFLGNIGIERAKEGAERFTTHFDDSSIVAALLLSRTEDDKEARMLETAARGTEAAQAALISAGLLADAPIDETIAFVQHVQQQLTGTWESEALVMAGGILAKDRSTPLVKAAFLVPGLFVRDEE